MQQYVAVTVALDRRGAASLTLKQEVRRGDEVLASGEVRIACLDAQRFVPVAIPKHVADSVLAICGATATPARRA